MQKMASAKPQAGVRWLRTSPTGKGACPPEDCGGVWGYEHLREVLADPAHQEHEDMRGWLGLDSAAEFDPASFNVDGVNGAPGLAALRVAERPAARRRDVPAIPPESRTAGARA